MDPCRDFFLDAENYAGCRAPVVQRFGELVRKVWNPRAFKGQVSPHEMMQVLCATPAPVAAMPPVLQTALGTVLWHCLLHFNQIIPVPQDSLT